MMMMMLKKTKMTTSKIAAALLLCALFAAAATPMSAGDKKLDPRAPYALIFGTVYGPDNRPARGVKIKIKREGGKKTAELYSDGRGEFAPHFPTGKKEYTVWADLKDKQAAQKTQVKVHVENDERQDLTLHLAK
jgi:hypothetical protein